MKIFICKTKENIFNHYLISDMKFTCFTFIKANVQEDNELKDISEFINTHPKDPYNLPYNISGEALSSSLANDVFYCAGAQTLDLSSIKRYDIASYAFLKTYKNEFPPVFNRFINTYISKQSNIELLSQLEGSFLAKVSIPFKDNNIFDDPNYIILTPGKLGYSISGIPLSLVKEVSMDELYDATLHKTTPDILLSGNDTVGPNGIDISILVQWHDGKPIEKDLDVYLKTDCGYLSKTKIHTLNGTGTTKLIPLGLQPGDKINLKAGFKFLPSLTTKGIVVNEI